MPDERLHVDLLHVSDGGMWMTAHGESRVQTSGGTPPYTAILTTAAVREPLRCSRPAGEAIAW